MSSSFVANSLPVINRQPRKFAVTRHSRPSISFSSIVLPLLCLALLFLPQLNSITLQALSDPSLLFITKPRIYTDNELKAAARRARPLPTCASDGTPAKTFLMVFMGHSGSTAMISELRGHPHVHIEIAELVDHQDVFNTTAALEATKAFFDKGVSYGKTPGFKIRPNHILNQPGQFRQLVRDYDTRVLWQYRQNIFKASVGEYATRYLNDTRAVEGLMRYMTDEERCSHEAGCSFRIEDFDFLHKTLKSKTRGHHLITDAVNVLAGPTGCVREIPYEDYLYNREDVMRDIQRFLGLRYEKTKPGRFKATGDSMCQVVENWSEVCRAFYGCMAWQHMMDDVKNNCFCDYSTGPARYCSSDM